MKTGITRPTRYKNCIVAPVDAGFDVFESSGRWFTVSTQKQAKWWISVHDNLQRRFTQHPPVPVPQAVEDHTPKPKETPPVTQAERADFRLYCQHCTNDQLSTVYVKETQAQRTAFANIARSELVKRGIA